MTILRRALRQTVIYDRNLSSPAQKSLESMMVNISSPEVLREALRIARTTEAKRRIKELAKVDSNQRLDLVGASLKGVVLDEVKMSAVLCRADLSHASLRKAYLRDSDLRGASFKGVAASGLDLRGSNWDNATFEDADLSGAALPRFTAPNLQWDPELPDIDTGSRDRLVFDRAALCDADMTICVLDGASIETADLTDANLDYASLNATSKYPTSLRGSCLYSAKLNSCGFIGADLRDTDLRYSQLAESHFHSTRLSGAYVREADLRNATLVEVDLRGVKDAENAQWDGAVLRHCTLTREQRVLVSLLGATVISG